MTLYICPYRTFENTYEKNFFLSNDKGAEEGSMLSLDKLECHTYFTSDYCIIFATFKQWFLDSISFYYTWFNVWNCMLQHVCSLREFFFSHTCFQKNDMQRHLGHFFSKNFELTHSPPTQPPYNHQPPTQPQHHHISPKNPPLLGLEPTILSAPALRLNQLRHHSSLYI